MTSTVEYNVCITVFWFKSPCLVVVSNCSYQCCVYYSSVRSSRMIILFWVGSVLSHSGASWNIVRAKSTFVSMYVKYGYQQWHMNSSTACSVPSSSSCWSASHGELEHTPDTQSGRGHWTCRKDQLVHCKMSPENSCAPTLRCHSTTPCTYQYPACGLRT